MADSTAKPTDKNPAPDPLISLHERMQGLEQSLQSIQKSQNDLRMELQRLQEFQRGNMDAAQLLQQALMIWADSEPSQMWKETQVWLQKAEQMVLDAQKPWTEEARKLWIGNVVEASTSALQEITAEYRERISTRANRAVVNLDRTAKKNMEDFADYLSELHEKYAREFEVAAENTLREQTRAIVMENKQIMERLIGVLQEQTKTAGAG
ncbi:hypothetical protein HMI48_05175 [Acidithiobacillus ferrooxidans]|uniref:hypothetical protein n=1 Tax=Acidithiobacillus ferrooxidans TaxID=920 RepID=UPI001C06D46F|nr:hypothetical protein [Acidithiobacillus ferrooxidans]MBU2773317.1 hypothetical protein [Acidithiobacillus ferrooxidans]